MSDEIEIHLKYITLTSGPGDIEIWKHALFMHQLSKELKRSKQKREGGK